MIPLPCGYQVTWAAARSVVTKHLEIGAESHIARSRSDHGQLTDDATVTVLLGPFVPTQAIVKGASFQITGPRVRWYSTP
jgi:hypothetical protein